MCWLITKTASPKHIFESGSYFAGGRPLPPLTPPKDDFSLDSTSLKSISSLDHSRLQIAQHWSGLNSPPDSLGQSTPSTFYTPSSTDGDCFKPSRPPVSPASNVAAVAVRSMGMGTAFDALNNPGGLINRRPAASGLAGQFELPPVSQFSNNYSQPRFPSLANVGGLQQMPASASLGNLLTPTSNQAPDSLSPVSSGLNSSSTPTNPGMPPFTPSFFGSGSTPNGFGAGYPPQTWQGTSSFTGNRGMFSPSLGSMVRNGNNSPSTGYLPPPDDISSGHLPPFQTSLPMSGATSVATSGGEQRAMSAGMVPNSSTGPAPTQSSPAHTQEGFSRPPPTPVMYGGSQPSSNPSNGHYQGSYSGPSPVQQSPHSMSGAGSRISPPVSQSPLSNQPPHFVRYPNPSYSLPAMPGPIMTNVHSPGHQMSMMGNAQSGMIPGFNSGYAANAAHMYAAPGQSHPAQAANNERPFKCDQCVQSFNRNHDLKRHKRIHLAVKPYPCEWCDKSFSRKDALKVR